MSRIPSPVALGSLAVLAACLALTSPRLDALTQSAPASIVQLSDEEMEQFLLKARVVKTRGAGKGITGSTRATLSDGATTHDAHIQIIDESKREFRSKDGIEFDFRDSWMFNVAAYKLDRLLGLKLVPVTVARRWKTNMASFTWWVDDVQMDEAERLKRKTNAPNLLAWNEEMQLVRLFDQLIYNIDRNLGNLVITNDWRVWAIDHTRAFRRFTALKTPGNIARCDREIFARLKALDKVMLRQTLGPHLQTFEIDTLLKRRDLIVALIEQRGDAGLFDRQTLR
jgi:hypothetical protein